MSFLPYGGGGPGSWILSGGASLLAHAGLVALLTTGIAQIQVEPEFEPSRPEYQISLEQLESDTLADIIESIGIDDAETPNAPLASVDDGNTLDPNDGSDLAVLDDGGTADTDGDGDDTVTPDDGTETVSDTDDPTAPPEGDDAVAPTDDVTTVTPEDDNGVATPEDVATATPEDDGGVATPEDVTTATPEDDNGVATSEDVATATPEDDDGVATSEDVATATPEDDNGVATPEDVTTATPEDDGGVTTPEDVATATPGDDGGVATPEDVATATPGDDNQASVADGSDTLLPGTDPDAVATTDPGAEVPTAPVLPDETVVATNDGDLASPVTTPDPVVGEDTAVVSQPPEDTLIVEDGAAPVTGPDIVDTTTDSAPVAITSGDVAPQVTDDTVVVAPVTDVLQPGTDTSAPVVADGTTDGGSLVSSDPVGVVDTTESGSTPSLSSDGSDQIALLAPQPVEPTPPGTDDGTLAALPVQPDTPTAVPDDTTGTADPVTDTPAPVTDTTPVTDSNEVVPSAPVTDDTGTAVASTDDTNAAVATSESVGGQSGIRRPVAAPSERDLAVGDLIQRIRAKSEDFREERGPVWDCVIALPRRSGDDGIGLAMVSVSDAVMGEFVEEVLVRPEDAEIQQTRALVDERQCAALTFIADNVDYPATRIGMRLDTTSVNSGNRVAGVMRGVGDRNLALFLVDNNGVVQDLDRFLSKSGEFYRFDIPVTRVGPLRDTKHLLMAVASPESLAPLKDRSGDLAINVFKDLSNALGRQAALAVVPFDVR